MLEIIARRLVQTALIVLLLSSVLFVIFDSEHFQRQVAVAELGGLAVSAMKEETYQKWLDKKGFSKPILERYRDWLLNLFKGDLGESWEHQRPVASLLGERLSATGILALFLFLFLIPLSLFSGIIAGMREHSWLDRSLSTLAIVTTSIPEIATAIFLSIIFALSLKWLPSKSTMVAGFEFERLVLPVLTLLIYDYGYIMRITRASVITVNSAAYIRTAILKGVGKTRLIFRHILRNALIAPFTIIVLQLNWLLSGVVVVEVFFQYDGFGRMLLQAALFGDVYVLQAGTLIAILVAVGSQLISDIGYVLINPRIRYQPL